MKTELKKETTEKTIDMDGNEKTEVVGLELSIIDKEGKQKGSANLNKHGINISLYGEQYNVEEWRLKIEQFIKTETEVEPETTEQ